jgi:hypothetical protein
MSVRQKPEAQPLAGGKTLVIYRNEGADSQDMRLGHKISNHRLLTVRPRQAVHTGASEWVVPQPRK